MLYVTYTCAVCVNVSQLLTFSKCGRCRGEQQADRHSSFRVEIKESTLAFFVISCWCVVYNTLQLIDTVCITLLFAVNLCGTAAQQLR